MYYHNNCPAAAISYNSADRCVIEVRNPGSTVIKAGTPVAIDSISPPGSDLPILSPVFNVIPANSEELFWGIAAADIAPNFSGNMIVAGIARAFITPGTGQFAVPGADGKLIPAASGNAEILWQGNEYYPGIVKLGSAGKTNFYKGAFAVRHIEGLTFEVYHGAYPEADPTIPHSMIAGYTDLPGAETFYRQEITITRDCTISLAAACVDGVYSAFLSAEPSPTVDEKVFDYTALASVTLSGKVTQHFTESRIYFGRYWFL